MAAIRARHGLRQVIGHAALLEEEQDNGDGHGIHQLGRTQTAPGKVRIHRQAGKGAAKIGDLTGCCDGAQQLQLALSCGGRRGGERIGQRQVSASRGTPHRAVQQGAGEIGGGDFRCGKRGELWVLLGGDATKDGAGALAAGAPSADTPEYDDDGVPVRSGPVDPSTGRSPSMFQGVDFHWFPLDNPGLVSIPAGFFFGWLGTVISKEFNKAKYPEMEVRSLTGTGAEKATVAH